VPLRLPSAALPRSARPERPEGANNHAEPPAERAATGVRGHRKRAARVAGGALDGPPDLLEKIKEPRAVAAEVHIQAAAEAHVHVHREPDRLSAMMAAAATKEPPARCAWMVRGRRDTRDPPGPRSRRSCTLMLGQTDVPPLATAPGEPLPDAVARRRGVDAVLVHVDDVARLGAVVRPVGHAAEACSASSTEPVTTANDRRRLPHVEPVELWRLPRRCS